MRWYSCHLLLIIKIMKHKLKKLKKYMKKHSLIIRDICHWAIFIAATFAAATFIADISSKQTMEVFIIHPEIAENSLLLKVWYLPSLK